MTIKEYIIYEKKVNDKIKALQDELKSVKKDVNFEVPFELIANEVKKQYPDMYQVLSVKDIPSFCLSDDAKESVESFLAMGRKKINATVECVDSINNVTICGFNVLFDMQTKLSNGKSFVNALRIGCDYGQKEILMDDKDIDTIIVDASPALDNYRELNRVGILKSISDIIEANQRVVEYVKQHKEGKRKADMLIETSAKLPSGMRPEKEKPIM